MIAVTFSGFVAPDFITEMALTVHTAFPNLEPSFTNLLFSYLVSQKFSPYRLFKSVEHVIQNCTSSIPTIAHFFKPYRLNFEVFDFTKLHDMLWKDYKNDWQSVLQTSYTKFSLEGKDFYIANVDLDIIQPFLQEEVFQKIFRGKYEF